MDPGTGGHRQLVESLTGGSFRATGVDGSMSAHRKGRLSFRFDEGWAGFRALFGRLYDGTRLNNPGGEMVPLYMRFQASEQKYGGPAKQH
jgi:hypothetical protein